MQNLRKKTNKTPLNSISVVYFQYARLFGENFSQTTTIHAGIFLGRALWADSDSLGMDTIASNDQFKPIRIRAHRISADEHIASFDQFKPIRIAKKI